MPPPARTTIQTATEGGEGREGAWGGGVEGEKSREEVDREKEAEKERERERGECGVYNHANIMREREGGTKESYPEIRL